MTIYIDSATLKEVEAAKTLGWVRGVTTNPLLLAEAGREAQHILTCLARLNFGSIFYQLVSSTLEEMCEETELAARIIESALVLKVPPTQTGFQFVSQCKRYPCCVTAIFSPGQALIASESGARYVAIYVNRATRLMGDGLNLVREAASVLKYSETEIIAASLKSPEEACAALAAGAHHLTLPYGVLTSMMANPFSEQTRAEFQSGGIGISIDEAKKSMSQFHYAL